MLSSIDVRNKDVALLLRDHNLENEKKDVIEEERNEIVANN